MQKGVFYNQYHNYVITFERERGMYHIYSPSGEEVFRTRSILEAKYTLKNQFESAAQLGVA